MRRLEMCVIRSSEVKYPCTFTSTVPLSGRHKPNGGERAWLFRTTGRYLWGCSGLSYAVLCPPSGKRAHIPCTGAFV